MTNGRKKQWEAKVIIRDQGTITIITVQIHELDDIWDELWKMGFATGDVVNIVYTNLNPDS